MMNRREFGACFPVAALAAPAQEWRNRGSGMSYRRLGRTGFMVSRVVMGGNRISLDNSDHVRLALDMGLNYLDTAPAYGNGRSEEGYAGILKSRRRDTVFLNTKVSLWDLNRNKLYREIFESLPEPEQRKLRTRATDEIKRRKVAEPDYFGDYFPGQMKEVEEAALANVMAAAYGHRIYRQRHYRKLILDSVDASLARLGTDHVDIVMCPHGACTPFELLNHPEIFEAFEALKKQGKARHLGVSAHNDPAGILDAAVAAKVYSVAMVAYNIVNHRFVDAALENAGRNDLGVIAMKAARPVWYGEEVKRRDDPARVKKVEEAVPGSLKVPQKAYVWALRNRNLTAVISEMVNAGHVRDNVPLGAGPQA